MSGRKIIYAMSNSSIAIRSVRTVNPVSVGWQQCPLQTGHQTAMAASFVIAAIVGHARHQGAGVVRCLGDVQKLIGFWPHEVGILHIG